MITISKYFIEYNYAMQQLGFSPHANQLVKRQAKYPHHIFEVDGIMVISLVLFEALKQYKAALNKLITIKNQKEASYDHDK